MYWRIALLTLVFLINVIPVAGQTLDVCATCHPNATCENKEDGSGKICNCMYGFVGNGRTFCQDKDECQIGASKICGRYTACHNTYGSYYCTCLAGYSPSNNMTIFIPNDGTHCQDIDECKVQGICGEGGQCRNIPGDFNCHCQVGYQVHNGAEPFRPHQNDAKCKVIDCGQPSSAVNAVQLNTTGTRYGNIATFACLKGFIRKSGKNILVCGAKGAWKGPSLICEAISCGNPSILPHTGQVWNGSMNPGSSVLYYCKHGYYREGGGDVSYCTEYGYWTKATLSCKEISCGNPSILPHAGQVWNGSTNPGSSVLYYCKQGYSRVGGGEISYCTKYGYWTNATLSCKEISCGIPSILPHAGQVWNGSTNPGSSVLYYCKQGYYREGRGDVSYCTEYGYWTNATLSCKEKCGPAPVLPNSEVVWQNVSTVILRCLEGFHSWRGSNTSVCDNTGTWRAATLRCREIKPTISDLVVFNEKCFRWKADKYKEDIEKYSVDIVGSRAYEKSFHDKRKTFLSSTSDHPKICLNLLPVTNYTISITASSRRFSSTLTINTSLQEPQAPYIIYREVEAPLPKLWLRRSANTLDPISFYQVFVFPLEGTLLFDCSSPKNSDFSSKKKPNGQYITAQFPLKHVKKEINLTLGDGNYYGGFYNAPLQNGQDYYIILRAVTQWGGASKYSCVIWAKVSGASYIMKVSSLFAGGTIAVFALAIFLGYCYISFFKKTCESS